MTNMHNNNRSKRFLENHVSADSFLATILKTKLLIGENTMWDQTIYCIQCDNPFTFTEAERYRLNSRGFDAPRRCPDCRKHKQKSANSENGRTKRGRKQYENWEIVGKR